MSDETELTLSQWAQTMPEHFAIEPDAEKKLEELLADLYNHCEALGIPFAALAVTNCEAVGDYGMIASHYLGNVPAVAPEILVTVAMSQNGMPSVIAEDGELEAIVDATGYRFQKAAKTHLKIVH